MSDAAQKFSFDTVFSTEGEVLRDGKLIKRILTQEEAEDMRKAGFEEGQSSETARAAQAEAEAMHAIAAQLQLILSRMHGESETLKNDAASLALSAASKISGAALDRHGIDTVEKLVGEVMTDLRAEPRLSVLCAPELAASLSVKLEELATKIGFEGAAIVRGEDGMTGADCRLEWAQGSIGRSSAEIEDRITQLVSRWLTVGSEDEDAAQETGEHVDPPGADMQDDDLNVA